MITCSVCLFTCASLRPPFVSNAYRLSTCCIFSSTFNIFFCHFYAMLVSTALRCLRSTLSLRYPSSFLLAALLQVVLLLVPRTASLVLNFQSSYLPIHPCLSIFLSTLSISIRLFNVFNVRQSLFKFCGSHCNPEIYIRQPNGCG